MTWSGVTFALIAAVLFAGIVGLGLLSRSIKREELADPEYQAQIARLNASYEAEETVMEQAPWIGSTGLDEDTERELPKYLRREFGELLLDENALKAADLIYIGSFPEPHGSTHFWRIPSRSESDLFAYVEVKPGGPDIMDWGGRKPPVAGPSSVVPAPADR